MTELREERDAACVEFNRDEECIRGEDFKSHGKVGDVEFELGQELKEVTAKLSEERDAAVSNLTEMKNAYEEKISNLTEKLDTFKSNSNKELTDVTAKLSEERDAALSNFTEMKTCIRGKDFESHRDVGHFQIKLRERGD